MFIVTAASPNRAGPLHTCAWPAAGRRAGTALLSLLLLCALAACETGVRDEDPTRLRPFTIAVIPDTQNYLDYTHQRSEGFALDGKDLFIAQMQDIVARDDVVFVASVGDVWQHSSIDIDPDHLARGIGAIENPLLAAPLVPAPETRSVEMPSAVEGYQLLHRAGIPFGVAPGNHDYDAFWSVEGFPPRLDKPRAELNLAELELGVIHVGGLDNFRSVFGADSEFFHGKPWYVDSYRGGANAAQVFEAGGYRFLHITLEMSPGRPVLEWVEYVLRDHPHYPTIITTHDYLNTRGERTPYPIIDMALADPTYHNNAQALWENLISGWDQIFMVLCGHHHGQSLRIDTNRYGNPVYQILADYQGRGQAGLDAGQPVNAKTGSITGLGDGWYRLMQFDLTKETPTVKVQTWSSYYQTDSSTLDSYADWYRQYEQPGMSDTEFQASDDFTLELTGFRKRFGKPGLQ